MKYAAVHDDACFVAAKRSVEIGQTHIPATPRQWAAWRAYFQDKGISTVQMDRRDYWTVPAEWPHLFDATATIQGDHAAADAPIREPRPAMPPPLAAARSFPKLWEAFADDREATKALNTAPSFDWLWEISKTLATRGKVAARSMIGERR